MVQSCGKYARIPVKDHDQIATPTLSKSTTVGESELPDETPAADLKCVGAYPQDMARMTGRRIVSLTVLCVMSVSAGCAATGPHADERLTVFAAASLEPVFSVLGQQFEEEHEGVAVTFNFAGSQDLQEQILNGARADVFASADEQQMQPVLDEGLAAGTPLIFATNALQIITPVDNPASVATFADLATPELALVICAPEVPCGAAAQRIAEETGVSLAPVSEEQSVADVLVKIQVGEGDAGLVYKTDAMFAGDTVQSVSFEESALAINRNPIVPLVSSANPGLAQEWVDFLLSPVGQAELLSAGFGPPDALDKGGL